MSQPVGSIFPLSTFPLPSIFIMSYLAKEAEASYCHESFKRQTSTDETHISWLTLLTVSIYNHKFK